MESLLSRPGPVILVAVVASPDARWAAELTEANGEARAVRELLQGVHDVGDTSNRPAHDIPRVIGVAALVSWEYVLESACSQHTHLLMAASAKFWSRRALPHFLEHRILGAASLTEPVPLPDGASWAPTSGCWSPALDPSTAAAVVSRPVLLTAGPGEGSTCQRPRPSPPGPIASKHRRHSSLPGQSGHQWPLH